MDLFSQIGKAVDAAANAVGDAVKKTDFSEVGKAVDAAANAVGNTAKNVDPFAVGSAATGGAAGAGLAATIGGMGLTFAGTGVAIGMAPVIAAGVIVGLSAYGVSKAIKPESKNDE